jgi:hypothetical protein
VSGRDVAAAEALALIDIADVAPDDVVFWTGAGISHDAPTCAPLGAELTERALDHLFEPGCLMRIRRYYRALRVEREHPRLETVLDVVQRVVGLHALVDVLSDIRQPDPNDLHAFFGKHLDVGGRHITANFDDCIERSRSQDTGQELIHFHGSFRADPGGAELGATLSNVQRGFPPDIGERMRRALTAPNTDVIVFAGYSGYDAFDVAPFLRSLERARELGGKKVVWIRFRRSGDDIVTVRHQSSNRQAHDVLERLAGAGASCIEVQGELRAVLAAFADRWDWPADLLPAPAVCSSTWVPAFSASGQEHRRASLELYATMGLYSEVRRLFAEHPPKTPPELEIAALAAAADGHYREAARLWRAAVPGGTAVDRARREEYVASCWWREGRLLKAYRHLRREVERADAAGVQGEPLWRLVSTAAHVFGHMRYRPLLRFFPTRRRNRYLARHLPTNGGDGHISHGPHADAMLSAARSRLGVGEEHSEEASLLFDEAEALHGLLNFRHAWLRRRGSRRDPGQWPNPQEYLDQYHDFRVIGLNVDAIRVPLLPGASHLFKPWDVWRGLGEPDFTLWHRLILFGGYLLRHARRR